jgi:hypothetical protein
MKKLTRQQKGKLKQVFNINNRRVYGIATLAQKEQPLEIIKPDAFYHSEDILNLRKKSRIILKR